MGLVHKGLVISIGREVYVELLTLWLFGIEVTRLAPADEADAVLGSLASAQSGSVALSPQHGLHFLVRFLPRRCRPLILVLSLLLLYLLLLLPSLPVLPIERIYHCNKRSTWMQTKPARGIQIQNK